MRKVLGLAWVLPLLAAGCNEPTYTDARGNVEVSPLDQNGMPTGVSKPTEEAVLPIYQLDTDMPDDFRVRREANRVLAMMRATATGTVPEMVPLLLRGDFAIQVDWTLKNLEDMPATATVVLNGSNEFVRYEPTMVMLGEDEDAPPALLGGTPFEVAAGATVNGTFREDQLDEATLDLDYIRRTPDPMPDPNMPGMQVAPICPRCGNPFRAILERPSPMTADQFVAGMTRVSITLNANRHMVLDFVVRLRERTDKVVAVECSTQIAGGMGNAVNCFKDPDTRMVRIPLFNPTPMVFGAMMAAAMPQQRLPGP